MSSLLDFSCLRRFFAREARRRAWNAVVPIKGAPLRLAPVELARAYRHPAWIGIPSLVHESSWRLLYSHPEGRGRAGDRIGIVAVSLLMVGVYVYRIQAEEVMLVAAFGDRYAHYRKRSGWSAVWFSIDHHKETPNE